MKLTKEKKMVTSEQFVTVYMELGGDLEAVSRNLGQRRSIVRARVLRMRKAGVKLPLKQKGKSYDVQSLNQLIKSMRSK